MSPAPRLRWTADVRRELLPNGLTLLVQRDPWSPAVAVVSWVKAGFFDEPDHLVGVSHVLEHMYFKGSAGLAPGTGLGPGALARETKAAGGYLNAHTSYDHTAYYVVLPPEGLRRAVEIQSTALRGVLIDPGELERELQVIIEEAKRKLDSPGSVAHETLHEVLFDQHRIRRWRIGTEAQLRGYGRDHIAGYYESRYVPERTIVAIVGNVDPEEALALGREYYGGWPARAAAIDDGPTEPQRNGTRVRTLRGDVTQAELVVGWQAPAALHPDETPLALAAATLTAGRGAWLYQSLRERGVVSSIGASHQAPPEVGVFSIGAELAPARVTEALKGIADAVTRLAGRGPTPDDMTRVRALLRQRWARRMESVDGRAMALASAEALGGLDLLEQEYAALASTSADEVRAAADRWLVPDAVAAVAYLPEKASSELRAEQIQRAFAPRRNGRPTQGSSSQPLMVASDRADLLFWRKPGVPLVSLGIYVPRTAFDPPAEAGLAALAARAMTRGAGELDAVGLAVAFERLGGVLSSSQSADWAGVSVTSEAGAIADAATLLATAASRPTFAEREVAAEKALVAEDQAQLTDDMFRYPFQLAYGEAFGDQTYGLPPLGTAESLAALGAADAQRWHQSVYGGARPVLAAVGDVDPDVARDALEAAAERLGGSAARRLGGSADAHSVAMKLGGSRVVARDRKQTALAMVFSGPDRRSEDRWAAEVWAAVAGGLGGRLFEALRDQRSLAYTVLASSVQRRHAGALVAYIATSPERETEAREQLLLELARFSREAVTEDEHSRAVNYLAGQALVSRQSTAAMLGELVDAYLLGGSLDEIEHPDARYRAVRREDVLRVADAFRDGLRVEGVVRGSA
ncbi:MAG TPA: pitrilysin family protein [Gemmatimonadales bacterium]|nr:pitrilysin family protein [Gemmatimonadales bacterium]